MQLSHFIYRDKKDQPFLLYYLAKLLSAIYGACVNLRNTLYERGVLPSHRLPGTCISVGNLVVGGTGKSPVVGEVIQMLLEAGAKPAVLSRGYGFHLAKGDSLLLLNTQVIRRRCSKFALREGSPDEARMLSSRFPDVPILVGRDRLKTAQWYLEQKEEAPPTHWILDDGFQHRRIVRDFNILLLDAKKPLGNGELLPLGPLREGLASIKRADFVLFTRCNPSFPSPYWQEAVRNFGKEFSRVEFLSHIGKDISQSIDFSSVHHPSLLVCGLAHPERLAKDLEEKGVPLHAVSFEPDHGAFDRQKILSLSKGCASILTSEKDYWRNPKVFEELPIPIFFIKLSIILSSDLQTKIVSFARLTP
ncbi:MAG: tetraacyldisaccharide 4'-kinase [Oligoflexales bacterium]|nr:tetraacyldisaccharide 4'-kinase [Oligoflexales bacterium]